MASISSSKRVCSDCVAWTRIGGGGALRAFERRFRNNNGPIPVAEITILHRLLNVKLQMKFFCCSICLPDVLAIDCIGVDETDVTFIGGGGIVITVTLVGDDIVSEADIV